MFRNAATAAALAILVSQPAAAIAADDAEVIPLIAVDSYATTALWTLDFGDHFQPEVDRCLAKTGNYRIRWNKAFGGTVAKTCGVLESLPYDLADIGIVTPPYQLSVP